MFWNINQLDFACLSAGVPLACLPSRATSLEIGDDEFGDRLLLQEPEVLQFQSNESSLAITNLDAILVKQKLSITELANRVGITLANLSLLINGQAKAIRLSTLEAICKTLDCQPGDILEFKPQQ